MTEKAYTSAELNAARVVAALDDNIAFRESERARLRLEKIAELRKHRTFLGIDITRSDDEAIVVADKRLNELHGENAEYYWHGYYIREMKVIRALALAAKNGTIRMSADDFQYISRYYNDASK